MTSRRAAALLIAGLILLAITGIAFWQFARPTLFPPPTSTPPPTATPVTFQLPSGEFTLPPSLEDLATQYPDLAQFLKDPELASAYKEFVAAYESGGIEGARALAKKRGILDDQDRLRATLELDTTDTAPLQAELKPYGVQVVSVYQNLMDIAIPLRNIEAVASTGNPAAIFTQLTQINHVVRVRLPNKTLPGGDPVPGEGVQYTGADLWHAEGRTGKGIKVGILDLGFKGYDQLLGNGLPQSVVAESFVPGQQPQDSDEVHGTAVAEIVYEMAPDAELYLAYYDGGDVSFGNAVNWLVSQGVNIISHSAGGSLGPMDGSESDASIVDAVSAQGILWVNASGNEAGKHYRGTFTDTDGDGWHEFPNGSSAMGVLTNPSGAVVYLNWDDWQQMQQDYNLYLYDKDGNLLASSEDIQNGTAGQWSAEAIWDSSVPTETVVFVRIKAEHATRPVTFDLYTEGYELQFPVAENSLTHPGDAVSAFTVGAVEGPGNELADYSSQGPSNDGRLKPEISAPAGVQSASYAPEVFHGTSASTPHVSGAAALVWAENPGFTVDQVKQYLIDNAIDLGATGPDIATGYGALHLPPPPGVTAPPPPTSGGQAPPQTSGGQTTDNNSALITIVLIGTCGAAFLCGSGLIVVGGVTLVVAVRRPKRPAPPPPLAPGAAVVAQARLTTSAGQVYAVQPGGATLGRAPECDIVLDNSQISRRHATIRFGLNGWEARDHGSSNGTVVNSQRLQPEAAYRLNSGDEIMMGGVNGVKLTFTAG